MPAPFVLGLAAGAFGAWFVSGTTEKVVKWVVIGGGIYVGAKAMKVL